MTMSAPAIPLDLIDRLHDCLLRARAIELAARGSQLNCDEKNALTFLAAAHVDQISDLADEIEALRAVEAKPDGAS